MNNVLLIDSDYEEAKDFVKGLEEATNDKWDVALYENNKVYGIKRYLKFFTVAWNIFCKRKNFKGKTVLCWQQFYGIALSFFCRLFKVTKNFNIVIMTFIYKPKSGIAGKLYYKFVKYAVKSKYVDAIICTSKQEIKLYTEIFKMSEDKFSFVKWGAVEYIPEEFDDEELKKKNYLFSTGRSNRDYNFLMEAIRDTKYNLLIACDTIEKVKESNIEVRDDLFGRDMLRYMRNSKAVVIVLDDDKIAAGQLVLLHAMNLGTPVIITKSHGVTDDYVVDGYNGLIIPKEKKCLYDVLEKLDKDEELYKRLSENSKKEFRENYTKFVLGKNIGKVVLKAKESNK